METYIGVDVGGTKILVGEIDGDGNILKHKKYRSSLTDQPTALKTVRAALDDYVRTVGWSGEKPVAMGVGVVGRVDTEQGVWLQIDPGRTQPVALAQELGDALNIPCRIDNDVKAATRAERRFGHGRTSGNFIYINIGTGIAAGFVTGGRLVRGSHHNAGEVGHTHAGVELGIKCGCGRTDCVELVAAGVGFDTCARLLAGEHETELQISAEDRVSVAGVYDLARKGDPLCVRLVENASNALANLIMNLVRVTDPDTVVLGGGVVSDGYLHEKVIAKLNPSTIRFVKNGVVLTMLDPAFIGLLGAGAVAMNV